MPNMLRIYPLYTAAEKLNLPGASLWHYVWDLKLLPAPTVPNRSGRRLYYSEDGLAELAGRLATLRADGTIVMKPRAKRKMKRGASR